MQISQNQEGSVIHNVQGLKIQNCLILFVLIYWPELSEANEYYVDVSVLRLYIKNITFNVIIMFLFAFPGRLKCFRLLKSHSAMDTQDMKTHAAEDKKT